MQLFVDVTPNELPTVITTIEIPPDLIQEVEAAMASSIEKASIDELRNFIKNGYSIVAYRFVY